MWCRLMEGAHQDPGAKPGEFVWWPIEKGTWFQNCQFGIVVVCPILYFFLQYLNWQLKTDRITIPPWIGPCSQEMVEFSCSKKRHFWCKKGHQRWVLSGYCTVHAILAVIFVANSYTCCNPVLVGEVQYYGGSPGGFGLLLYVMP